jgi:hypothetical protein
VVVRVGLFAIAAKPDATGSWRTLRAPTTEAGRWAALRVEERADLKSRVTPRGSLAAACFHRRPRSTNPGAHHGCCWVL